MFRNIRDMELVERAYFDQTLEDNLFVVQEMLDAMRDETAFAADGTTSAFLAGLSQAIYAFAMLREKCRGP